MNYYRGHIPICEPSAGSYQIMLLKNSISLESFFRVTIAFLEAAV